LGSELFWENESTAGWKNILKECDGDEEKAVDKSF
jgi:hypothetical protein